MDHFCYFEQKLPKTVKNLLKFTIKMPKAKSCSVLLSEVVNSKKYGTVG